MCLLEASIQNDNSASFYWPSESFGQARVSRGNEICAGVQGGDMQDRGGDSSALCHWRLKHQMLRHSDWVPYLIL